jgi:hypothetical protein
MLQYFLSAMFPLNCLEESRGIHNFTLRFCGNELFYLALSKNSPTFYPGHSTQVVIVDKFSKYHCHDFVKSRLI